MQKSAIGVFNIITLLFIVSLGIGYWENIVPNRVVFQQV